MDLKEKQLEIIQHYGTDKQLDIKPCPFCGGDAVFKKEEDKAVIFCSEEYCLAFMCVKFDFIDGFDNSGDCIRHLKENWNRRVPEWIPATKKRPEELDTFIALDKSGRVFETVNAFDEMEWITHWMPMPEPPEGWKEGER